MPSEKLSFDVEAELGPQGGKPGRPRVIPMKSILRSLPTTAERADKQGLSNIDFSMTAEVLAVLGAINLESGLGDDKTPLKDRVEWTLRLAPFLNTLREGFKRQKGAKLPKTTEELAKEASKRSASIKKLMAALKEKPAIAGAIAAQEVLPEDESTFDPDNLEETYDDARED